MGRNIEVETQALTSLSRDYKMYGQNVYSRYKTGSSRIERELESIIRKYSEYSSVTSKARNIQSKLREIERQAKEIEARSSKLSQGLNNVAASYKEEETRTKNIIQSQNLSVNKVSNKTTNVKVAIKLDSQLTAAKVGAAAGTAAKAAIDKVHDLAEDVIDKVKNSSVVSNIKGISKKVTNTLSNIKTSVTSAATNFGNKVSEVATGIKKTAVNFTSEVKDKWENLKTGVKGFAKKSKDFVCDLGEKIMEGLTGAFNKFKEVAQKAVEYIKDKGDVILETAKKVAVKILDGFQFILDLAGLFPGLGELADGLNGIIYTLRGDALNAALSFAACIPFAGWAATGGKIVGKLAKFVDKIGDIGKLVDKVKDFAKYFDKVKDLGKTVMKYGDNVINFIRKKGDDIWSFISKNKVIDKAAELVNKINKFGYDVQGYLVKQVDKVSAKFGEWWMKQAQVGIVPKEVAEWINRSGMKELQEEVIEKEIKEEIREKSIKKSSEELENINKFKFEATPEGYKAFKRLDTVEQVKVFDSLNSNEIYNLVKNSTESWPVDGYDLITSENAKDFIILSKGPSGEVSFNLDWPKYGGYAPETISSVKNLNGQIPVSRDGGDGGYTMGIGKNADGTYSSNSERAIPKSSAEVNAGIFNVDLYKETVDIVAGGGSDFSKIEKLIDIGIDDDVAEDLLKDYKNWMTRPEIVGENSISDGVVLAGKNIESKYGYHGNAAEWNVGDIKMSGGAGQMNTVYSWGTLKEAGIIFDVEKVKIN